MMKRYLLLLITTSLLAQNPNTAKFPGTLATDQDLLAGKDQSASTLSAGIGASDTAIPVADGTKFVGYEVVSIGSEQILVCSVSSNTLNVCTGGRGFAGTTAAAHSSGALVRGHITAWHHNQLAAELKAVENQLGVNLANVAPVSHDHDTEYVSLFGSYANPDWLTSCSWLKLTDVPSSFAPSAHTHPWTDLTGNPTSITLAHTAPVQYFDETDASADNGHWRFAASGDDFYFQTFSDDYLVSSSIFSVGRTGTTPNYIRLWPAVQFGDASTTRTNLGLGDAATKNVGTASGTVAAGDHGHSGTYAPASQGVTNGNSHDHNGGDGAQIAHGNLSGVGTNTHAQIDSHLGSTANPHSVTAAQVGAATSGHTHTIKRSFTYTLFDASSALDAGDMDIPSIWVNRMGLTATITEVRCEIDAGSASINLQRDDGSAANVLSSDLACSTGGATTTSFSGSEATISDTRRIDHVTVSSSTAKRMNITITYTVSES